MTNIFKSIKAVFNHPQNQGKLIVPLSKVIFWKVNQIFFKYPMVVNFSPSTRIICYPDSSYSGLIFYCGFPEYEEIEFINRIFPKNGTMIDVGANLGDLACLIGSKSSATKVYAFEPSPLALQRLNENIKVNNLEKNVFPIGLVASDIDGKITFSQGNRSEIDHISHGTNIDNDKLSSHNSVRLDSFFKKTGLSKIDVLKIDVEGAEYLVLSGASSSIKQQKIDVIVTEINVNSQLYGHYDNEVFNLLIRSKYQIYLITSKLKLSKLKLNNPPNEAAYNIVAISSKAISKYKSYLE
jgi:FkbM family methyltransferase